MRRNYRCYGGVYDTATAYYLAAMDFGFSELTLRIGNKSVEALGKKLNIDNKSHLLTESEAMRILEVTKDPRILDAIANRAGIIWIDEEKIPKAPGELDLFEAGASFSTAAAAVQQEISDSLADGDISSEERSRIEKKAFDLRQHLQNMIEVIEPFCQENHS